MNKINKFKPKLCLKKLVMGNKYDGYRCARLLKNFLNISKFQYLKSLKKYFFSDKNRLKKRR